MSPHSSAPTTHQEFLNTIEDPQALEYMTAVLDFVTREFPELGPVIKWKQPMFVLDRTFIIGFSYAKHHIAVAPEGETLEKFRPECEKLGLSTGKQLVRINYTQDIPYNLLRAMVEEQISLKRGSTRFWRD